MTIDAARAILFARSQNRAVACAHSPAELAAFERRIARLRANGFVFSKRAW